MFSVHINHKYFDFSIDLFTHVSQIYGCFFPQDLVTNHFINLFLTMVLPISILGIHFAYISFLLHLTNLRQAFRLSGTTFVKMVCIKFVNPSIPFYFNHTPPPLHYLQPFYHSPQHLYFLLPSSLRNLLLLNILHINMSVRLVSNFIFQGIWELWVHNPLLKGPWTLGGRWWMEA